MSHSPDLTTMFLITRPVYSMVALSVAFACCPILAQSELAPSDHWPANIEFDDQIMTPREYLGFDVGQRHIEHRQLVGYLKKIASQSNRIQYRKYGQTHGERDLVLLVISSPKNLKEIGRIRKARRRVFAPENAQDQSFAEQPLVINMGYGVHGDEASASNCAALVAFYLAAAKGPEMIGWLNNTIILLDPCLNPDGFNRFANWVNNHRGQVPNSDPRHREHNQLWPTGRVNYYWFDLNRDWLPLAHPESQARMKWYHQWKPNVVLDFHEMGTQSTYLFQPGVPRRTYPTTPARNRELTAKFARYHANALDQKGTLYFTKERFDDFYMGKGSTYPDLHGAVGILFEQASARGHLQTNQDGDLTFHRAVSNHFATSLSSLQAANEMRSELLQFQQDFYSKALKRGMKKKKRVFIFNAPGNPTRIKQFAEVLRLHDIQWFLPKVVGGADGEASRLFSDRYRMGEFILVPQGQREYQFLNALLSRKKSFEENVFYDVSSWSLDQAYDVEKKVFKGEFDKNDFVLYGPLESKQEALQLSKKSVACVVPYRDDQACQILVELLEAGVNVKMAKSPFACKTNRQTVEFERGTLMIPLKMQIEKLSVIQKIV
ncbi:MAG: M14 family metallopeptidase, partial [Planctomycetota bacterium]